jgi:4-amino-4-deoxy-L-arabinose transferase-like glycosyltransferase
MSKSEYGADRRSDPVPAPACPRFPWAWLLVFPRRRIVVDALVLTILAGICCFFRLSEGTLLGDEAAFACTTDRMRATGDWVVPFIADKPHLNATPLYNWLTLALVPWSDGTPLWYRFWSAAFGVGCVLMGYALGALLFRAEVGLLAGLFLAFNRNFLFCHGIRFGGMDAMLAFFVSAAAFCYAWLQTRPARAGRAWALLGLCIGAACLSKPPVFGGFFLTLIILHWLVTRRRGPLAVRVVGPLLAVAAGLLVAAPWYVLLWSRLGNPCLHVLFIYNSVDRALDPMLRDFLCCHRAVWDASSAFKLMEPGLACALGCWLTNQRRPQWGLLLFLAGGYLLALTAAGKAGNYIYYAFPLLAVLLAGLFLESGPRLVAWRRPGLARTTALAGLGLAVVLVGADCIRTLRVLAGPVWVHPPVGIYERLGAELAQRRCRFVLFDFPFPDGTTASGRSSGNFEDLYYPAHMPLADRARDVKELSSLLEDGRPAVVLFPPLTVPQPRLADLRPEVRVAENRWPFYTYPVLAFHGAAAKIPPAELVRLARGSQP